MRSTDKEKKIFMEKKTHFSGACTLKILRLWILRSKIKLEIQKLPFKYNGQNEE